MRYYKEHDARAFFPGGRWLMNILIFLNWVVCVKLYFFRARFGKLWYQHHRLLRRCERGVVFFIYGIGGAAGQ